MSLVEKQILKSRITIEHSFNKYKKFKKINIRYDKYIKNYIFYLQLATLHIFIKST